MQVADVLATDNLGKAEVGNALKQRDESTQGAVADR